jgi:type IV secretory pathway VirJ component
MQTNVVPGNYTTAWQAIAIWYAVHPVTVQVNADAGNISTAWSQIQTYFNQHPITVRVNTVQGTVSAPAVPGATSMGAARPSAEETAMGAMGLTAVGDTLLAAPAPVTAGVAAPVSTPAVINLNVNMPVGTNEAKVVDLLRRYQRSNGTRVLPRR